MSAAVILSVSLGAYLAKTDRILRADQWPESRFIKKLPDDDLESW